MKANSCALASKYFNLSLYAGVSVSQMFLAKSGLLRQSYRDTSPKRNTHPLRSYGGVVSYERGAPVGCGMTVLELIRHGRVGVAPADRGTPAAPEWRVCKGGSVRNHLE